MLRACAIFVWTPLVFVELWDGVDRHHFNAIVSEQDAIDTYLPAFQSCVGTFSYP
jgi:hypothetical protein